MAGGPHPKRKMLWATSLELFGNPVCPSTARVRVCLEEKGVAYTFTPVELIETGDYGNLSRAYLRVNPGGLVPTLVHEGVPVYESAAILEYVDALLYRSCRHVADSADAEALCLTFSYRDRDCARAVDLGPGGADRDVDASNKDEYVARLFKFAMLDVVSKPLGKFLKGFYEVLPLAALNAAAFDPGDLELAIAGLDDVDVGDWRAHTEYSQGYDDDDPAVANFWSFVAGLPDEKRAKLLQFVTGTSRLPAGGFANLQGRDGVTKGFELRRRPGGDKAFPVAHTCFNRLDLPAYSDVAVLARILSAILEGDVLGFSGD